MKGNNWNPYRSRNTLEQVSEWWEDLDLGEKAAVVWLTIVGLVLITVGIIFPVAGFIMFIVAAIIGTFAALAHLLI